MTTSDGAKWRLEKEHLAREYCIAVEEIKIMQEKLRECYYKEGVNYRENCQDLAKALWKKMHTPNYGAPGPSMGVRRPLPAKRLLPHSTRGRARDCAQLAVPGARRAGVPPTAAPRLPSVTLPCHRSAPAPSCRNWAHPRSSSTSPSGIPSRANPPDWHVAAPPSRVAPQSSRFQ